MRLLQLPSDAAELLDRITEARLPDTWSNSAASLWWQARLPQLAGPLIAN